MRFNWYPVSIRVPPSSARDVLMPREDRAFRELTVYGRPHTGRVNGTRTPGAIVNVTGVTIVASSFDTVTGAATGTLRWTANPRRLRWQAPGSQEAGTEVGVPELTGQRLIHLTGGDSSFIDVNVNAALLPAANATDLIAFALVVPPAQARNFTSEVFFGPTSQGAAIARLTDEEFLIFDPGDTVRLWPPNEPSSNPQRKGTKWEIHGFDITVRINNLDAVNPLGITIEFSSMTIDSG